MENNNRQGCREEAIGFGLFILAGRYERFTDGIFGAWQGKEDRKLYSNDELYTLYKQQSIEPCATSSDAINKEVQKWKDKHYTAMQRIVELESAFAGAEEMVKDKIKKISEIEIILDQIGKDNAIAITAIENIYLAKLTEMRKERDGCKNSNDNSYDLWHEQEAENRELSKQLEYWKSLYKALEKYTEDPYQSLENYKAWQQLKLNQP